MWLARFVRILFCLCVFGCVTGQVADLSDTVYRHRRYPISIALDDASLLPGWRVRNWYRSGGEMRQRLDGHHMVSIALDLNDDGETDKRVQRARYHVLLEHSESGGRIWLRTFPLSGRYRGRNLGVVLREYAADLSGGTYELAGLRGALVLRERRTAATIVADNPASVMGSPAHAATIDIADVDQLRLNSEHRLARARVVMANPRYVVAYQSDWGQRVRFPMVATIGYVNTPEFFERGLPAFESFVRRVRFNETGATTGIVE